MTIPSRYALALTKEQQVRLAPISAQLASLATILEQLKAFFTSRTVHAAPAIITATSCNSSDVQTAINAAVDGDTVQIPAGTCSWTTSGVTVTNKVLTIQGAGIDQTIIVDALPKGTSNDPIPLDISTVAGKFFRLTG